VTPAARQGGTAGRPSGEVRLARGLDAPSGEVRLARGHPHARYPRSCPRVRAFNALTPQDAHHDSDTPGNHAPVLFRQLPRGNPSPPLCSTVWQGRCQLRDTAAYPRTANTPRPRRGAGGTLECLFCADAGPHCDIRPAGSVIPSLL
jgi:hypothetical protein